MVVSGQETTTEHFSNTGAVDRSGSDVETQSVQVGASDASSCIAGTGEDGKMCHSLTGELDNEEVAKVCVELVGESLLRTTFTGVGDWVLVTSKFWFDEDISTVPRVGSTGGVDMAALPYFLCNSTDTLNGRTMPLLPLPTVKARIRWTSP